MNDENPTIRRLVFACDIVRYGRHDEFGQGEAQSALHTVLAQAAKDARLDRGLWSTQDQGDGELAALAAGMDEARVISEYFAALRNQLYQYNRKTAPAYRLRLRFAVHQGNTRLGPTGFVGDAPVHVCRLLDGAEPKKALLKAEDADIVLIVSSSIYEEVIAQNRFEPRADEFRRVTVEHPEKAFRADAWIHLPNRIPPSEGTAKAEPRVPMDDDQRRDDPPVQFGGGDQLFSGSIDIDAGWVAQRDVHEVHEPRDGR